MMEILPYLFERFKARMLQVLGGSGSLPVDIVLQDGIDSFVSLWSFNLRVC